MLSPALAWCPWLSEGVHNRLIPQRQFVRACQTALNFNFRPATSISGCRSGQPLPSRWREALFALRDGLHLRDRLGCEVADAYFGMKFEEQQQYHELVSQLDLLHYFRTVW